MRTVDTQGGHYLMGGILHELREIMTPHIITSVSYYLIDTTQLLLRIVIIG